MCGTKRNSDLSRGQLKAPGSNATRCPRAGRLIATAGQRLHGNASRDLPKIYARIRGPQSVRSITGVFTCHVIVRRFPLSVCQLVAPIDAGLRFANETNRARF